MRLTDASSPTANGARIGLLLDGQAAGPDSTVVRGGPGIGLHELSASEATTFGVRMTVSDGSGGFVGEIDGASAHCL
ncbi:MAG: hypothetical protein ACRDPH_13815 [Marmoricola sp.]